MRRPGRQDPGPGEAGGRPAAREAREGHRPMCEAEVQMLGGGVGSLWRSCGGPGFGPSTALNLNKPARPICSVENKPNSERSRVGFPSAGPPRPPGAALASPSPLLTARPGAIFTAPERGLGIGGGARLGSLQSVGWGHIRGHPEPREQGGLLCHQGCLYAAAGPGRRQRGSKSPPPGIHL